jgi:DNA-binding CsgD family transcriptional regulator
MPVGVVGHLRLRHRVGRRQEPVDRRLLVDLAKDAGLSETSSGTGCWRPWCVTWAWDPRSPPLDEVFERFDGRGGPRHTSGDALSLVGRVATVAHVAVVFCLSSGPTRAQAELAQRSGQQLGAALAKWAAALVGALTPSAADALAERLPALERFAAARPLTATVREVAEAFADFADLQLPCKRGHSLKWVALGKTNKEIATALGISARTVQHHTIHIYEKLGVDTRAAAAIVGSKQGWLG